MVAAEYSAVHGSPLALLVNVVTVAPILWIVFKAIGLSWGSDQREKFKQPRWAQDDQTRRSRVSDERAAYVQNKIERFSGKPQ